MNGTGIFIRVMRGNRFENLDLADMTLEEIESWITTKDMPTAARTIRQLAQQVKDLREIGADE